MFYFSESKQSLYTLELFPRGSLPLDAQEVSEGVYWEILSLVNSENIVQVVEGSISYQGKNSTPDTERSWRNHELARADIELNKVQDSDPKAVGTVTQWREYRKALRAWPEHDDFLIKESRPSAPDL